MDSHRTISTFWKEFVTVCSDRMPGWTILSEKSLQHSWLTLCVPRKLPLPLKLSPLLLKLMQGGKKSSLPWLVHIIHPFKGIEFIMISSEMVSVWTRNVRPTSSLHFWQIFLWKMQKNCQDWWLRWEQWPQQQYPWWVHVIYIKRPYTFFWALGTPSYAKWPKFHQYFLL